MNKINDTHRLDWVIEKRAIVVEFLDAFRVNINDIWVSGWKNSAREAIDDAITKKDSK